MARIITSRSACGMSGYLAYQNQVFSTVSKGCRDAGVKDAHQAQVLTAKWVGAQVRYAMMIGYILYDRNYGRKASGALHEENINDVHRVLISSFSGARLTFASSNRCLTALVTMSLRWFDLRTTSSGVTGSFSVYPRPI